MMRDGRTMQARWVRQRSCLRFVARMALASLVLALLALGEGASLEVGWLVAMPEHGGPSEIPTEHSQSEISQGVGDVLTHSERRLLVPPAGRRQHGRHPQSELPRQTLTAVAWRGFLTPLRC